MQKEGLLLEYAIAGGIGVIFYIEPILTYDLDIFFKMPEESTESSARDSVGKGLVNLSPIYQYLKTKGYHEDKEHIVIENIPVQFIPVYNDLVKEAVENAAAINFQKTKTKVVNKEYLIAIMLQTFRPKDKERIIMLLGEKKINVKLLDEILIKHNLVEKYNKFLKMYYEK